MLEIRLNLLNDHVDYFVLIEATKTFSGFDKPLYYLENKERFAQFNHKIKHYIIDDYNDEDVLNMAKNSPNTGAGESHWVMEFYQKEKIKEALIDLDDGDICYVSDVDEIWKPVEVGEGVYKPKQDLCYIYYLNQRTNENWAYFTGTIVTKYKNIKDACLNHLRTHGRNDYIFIENGGWHFNALGGADKKIEAFKHPIYTPEYMKSREKGLRVDESDLPQYLLDNKEKYKHLFI